MTLKEVEKQYGVDFGTRDKNDSLSDYLREQGYNSLAKVLDSTEKQCQD